MECACQNCNRNIIENFCGNCGQKQYKRIDRKYIGDELQYTLIHTNKGFLYSVKNILKNPGKSALEFIDGNRVNHYKPIGLAFVLSGISAFISFKLLHFDQTIKAVYAANKLNSPLMNDFMSFSSSYSAIIMLMMIPVLAILSKIAFNKWGQNYYEHVVMNAFGLSFYTIFGIFTYPFIYLAGKDLSLVSNITTYSMLLIPLMMIWFYKSFYKDKPLKFIILRILLKMMMFGVIYVGVIIATVVVFLVLKGAPESMKYLQPVK